MAEVFTLKKRQRFQFALEEDPGKVYSLPPLSSLSFEDAQLMAKLGDETTIVKQGEKIKKFILGKCPELEGKGLDSFSEPVLAMLQETIVQECNLRPLTTRVMRPIQGLLARVASIGRGKPLP